MASRLMVVVALGGFLAGTIGVPVVLIESNKKDRSQLYPCMGSCIRAWIMHAGVGALRLVGGVAVVLRMCRSWSGQPSMG
jgi:hypothetical protein